MEQFTNGDIMAAASIPNGSGGMEGRTESRMAGAAEDKTGVSLRHREEWRLFRQNIFTPACESRDADDLKVAKSVADILKVYQEGERKAYGFADGDERPDTEISADFQG